MALYFFRYRHAHAAVLSSHIPFLLERAAKAPPLDTNLKWVRWERRRRGRRWKDRRLTAKAGASLKKNFFFPRPVSPNQSAEADKVGGGRRRREKIKLFLLNLLPPTLSPLIFCPPSKTPRSSPNVFSSSPSPPP